MHTSTRVCIAPDCISSRIITSIKDLENHKGHNSSSLGLISKKLKDQFPQIDKPLKHMIQENTTKLFALVQQLQDTLIRNLEHFSIFESISDCIHQVYDQLDDVKVDKLVSLLTQQISLDQYSKYQKEVESLYTTCINFLETKLQIQSFVPLPNEYTKFTNVQIVKNIAKHMDGYPTFILINQQVQETKLTFKMVNIQETYVGVGLGMVEKSVISEKGLLIPMENLQVENHGLYMNFNDKCVYNSEDLTQSGQLNGQNKGIQFKTGDIVTLEYKNHLLTFSHNDNEYQMKIPQKKMYFVAWLDLSEIHLI